MLADFVDTPAEAQFRAEVRAWLQQTNAELRLPHSALIEDRLAHFRLWQRAAYEAGYAGLSWPKEYGGRAATAMQQAIWNEEVNRSNGPELLNGPGERLAGPTIIEFGTDDQRGRYLQPILVGDEIWCQLFSEPAAGSDLAGLQARAVRVAGGWRITGQKVWTGRAQISDFGMLLARTSAEGRHRGITFFILPMRQAGVTVIPLKQMTGEAEFNEVFIEDVFVPDELVVGEVGDGWHVAMSTLQQERAFVAMGRIDFERWFEELLEEIRRGSAPSGHPAATDECIRQKAAQVYERSLVQRVMARKLLTRLDRGESPGGETSLGKLMLSALTFELTNLASQLNGLAPYGDPETINGGPGSEWQQRFQFARGMSIGGGTAQIHKNILAERVLGLPRG